MQDSLTTPGRLSFPVAVLVEHQAVHDNRWIDGRWVVTGVVASESLADAGVHCRQIHGDAESQQYLWSGLSIELHRDDTESYYANLMSDTPGVFVICEGEQDDRALSGERTQATRRTASRTRSQGCRGRPSGSARP